MRAIFALSIFLLASPAFAQTEAPPPGDDCECDDCDNCPDFGPSEPPDLAPLPNPYERRVIKGYAFSVLGGGDLRARDDLQRYALQLGPAGDPSLFGGLLSLQAVGKVTRYLRVGADFTYTRFDALSSGPDRSGLLVQQKVGYEFVSGGLVLEGVLPLHNIELSLGTVVGGGHFGVSAFSSRVQNFNQLGANFQALPATDTLSIGGDFFALKPALGLRFNASAHLAIDLRVGMNLAFVAGRTLAYNQGLPIDNAPGVTELEPFVQVGLTIGDWLFGT